MFDDPPGPETLSVSRELQQAWVHFATDGDPGWPAHRADHRLTRVLDVESQTIPYPEEASRRVWENDTPAPFDVVGGNR